MDNEVTTRNSNLPAAHAEVVREQVLRSDILVPYLTMAQSSSDFVKERKAQMGDIIRSTNCEKLGDPEVPVQVIYLHYPKANWVIEERPKGETRFQWRKTIPRDAGNETLPWTFWQDAEGNEVPEGTKGASEWRRQKQLLVFALLPQDIAAARAEMAKVEMGELPDPSKALTPVLISFRSTSYKAGKEVCTFFTQAASMKVPIWKYFLPLTCSLEQNDDGSFYVWNVDRAVVKPVSKDDLPLVQEWVDLIGAGVNLTVDEGGESGVDAPAESSERVAARGEVC